MSWVSATTCWRSARITTEGLSPRGDSWRIAVERPELGQGGIQAAVQVTDAGVATSGDYRNFYEHEGQRYSHLIDPRTGYPITHDLVSVTVIHPSTALADARPPCVLVGCVIGAGGTAEIGGLPSAGR